MRSYSELPTRLWFVLPVAILFVYVPIVFASHATQELLLAENGFFEIFQALLLAFGVVLAVQSVRLLPRGHHTWLAAWLILAAVCCVWVCGEEVSWGQWFFHWQTPEYWKLHNQQQETNLHNSSRALNQVPRRVLELGVIVGGLIMPLMQRHLPKRFTIIYPPGILSVTTLCYLGILIVSKLGKYYTGEKIIPHPSETQETFLYIFVLLYLIVMKKRVKALA